MTLKCILRDIYKLNVLKSLGLITPTPDVHVQLQLWRRGIKNGREAGREASPVSLIPVSLPPLVPLEFLMEHDGAISE